MNNFYLLSFDPHKSDAETLHKVIDDNPNIKDWWHFLASTYILVSDKPLQTIDAEITENWPNQRYILIRVDLSDHNGWLPQNAWDWMKKYSSK